MKPTAETITVKGQVLKLYRQSQDKAGETYTTYLLAYTANGDRHRKGFASEADARAAAKEIGEQLAKGTGHAHSLTPSEVADFMAAKQSARRLERPATLAAIADDYVAAVAQLPPGVALRDAVAAYRKTHDRAAVLSAATVEEIKDRFIKSRENNGASDRHLEDIRARLTTFAKTFRCQIASITAPEITTWLDGLKVAARTQTNYRRAVVSLFRYARRQGCLPRNETTEAELVDAPKTKPSKVGIYTPGELRTLLDGMPKHMRPGLAVAAFAGLRSAEVFRLDWSEVDLRGGYITVAADKAKTAQRRLVPILPVLADWLRQATERKGKVIGKDGYSFPTAWDRAIRREMAAMNERRKAHKLAPFPRIPNGLRHSFASYRLAVVQSADKVALEMGNSPRKLFTNYRELVSPEDAVKWFAVRPARRPRNVVDYKAA